MLIFYRNALIVNGPPTKPFKMESGLRWGDPLSLFIFVFMADVMHRILNKAKVDGVIEGIGVDKHRVHLSHLQFANVTILFAPMKKEVLVTLLETGKKSMELSMEKFIKSIGNNFIDRITNKRELPVTSTSEKRKLNITNG